MLTPRIPQPGDSYSKGNTTVVVRHVSEADRAVLFEQFIGGRSLSLGTTTIDGFRERVAIETWGRA